METFVGINSIDVLLKLASEQVSKDWPSVLHFIRQNLSTDERNLIAEFVQYNDVTLPDQIFYGRQFMKINYTAPYEENDNLFKNAVSMEQRINVAQKTFFEENFSNIGTVQHFNESVSDLIREHLPNYISKYDFYFYNALLGSEGHPLKVANESDVDPIFMNDDYSKPIVKCEFTLDFFVDVLISKIDMKLAKEYVLEKYV